MPKAQRFIVNAQSDRDAGVQLEQLLHEEVKSGHVKRFDVKPLDRVKLAYRIIEKIKQRCELDLCGMHREELAQTIAEEIY